MHLSSARLALAIAALALPVIGSAATGRTPGSFTVTANGAAQYSIPLWVPPGVRGVQPQLALVYNSHFGSGVYGQGWVLSGLSTISRCNRTIAQDGIASSPQLDTNDRFCADGNRLRTVPAATTYGADSTSYQTEVADFTNFVSHGTAGVGPAYFTAKGKNGLSYEYGNTADSAILASGSSAVRVWALNKVSDRDGNSMSFTYTNDTTNGSYRIASIAYTATSAGAAAYSVQFQYQSRATADGQWSYTIGGKNNEFNLLDQIIIKSGATVVKIYDLDYENSPVNSVSRLTSIKECAASVSDCLLPTTMTYDNGAAALGTEITSGSALGIGTNTMLPIDLNGDGHDDLVYYNSGTGTWYYLMGTSSGSYSGPYNTGVTADSVGHAIDFDGDGQMEVLVAAGTTWKVMRYTATGSTFTLIDTGITLNTKATTADLNGDGLTDLIYAVTTTGYGQPDSLYYRLNTGDGFGAETLLVTYANGFGCSPCSKFANFTPPLYSFFARQRRLDFNGDGREDLLVRFNTCDPETGAPGKCGGSENPIITQFILFLSLPNGSYAPFDSFHYGGGAGGGGGIWPLVGDFNGDGCSDVTGVVSSGWQIQFGTCGRAGVPTILGTAVATGQSAIGANNPLAMDIDGDGRDDIVQPVAGTLGYLRSTGNSLSAWTTLSVPFSTTSPYVADVDGDGAADLVYPSASGLPAVRLHSGNTPDVLHSITDGFGNSVSFTYTSIALGSYTKSATPAVYPEQDTQRPMIVVSQVVASDGIGGTYTKTYSYSGGRVDLKGRGFEGFLSRVVTDSRPAALTVKTFFQLAPFPLMGVVDHEDVYQSNGSSTVSHTQYTNGYATIDPTTNNQRYFVKVTGTTLQNYEVGGPRDGQLITTTATTSAYDGYGNVTSVATTVTDEDTSPYHGEQWTSTVVSTITPDDGANWCLNLPTQVTTTNTAPGVPSITRTMSFTPDYTKCRATAKTYEPSSPTYAVTESYGFDAFGNTNSVTVTGAGVAARNTTINWGATGQFPTTVTNPLSQPTVNGYDLDRGLLTSVTDPNNVTTSYQYDSFRRRILETRPDGTSTTWTYNDCSAIGCVNSNNKMVVTQTVKNSNGTTQTDSFTYLDKLERPLVTSARLLSGAYDRKETIYDAFGRVSQQSVPCLMSSCAAYWMTFSYDALNRVTQMQRPVSASDSTLQTTTTTYAGRTTTVTDPQGKQSVKITTVAGTLGRSQDHNGYYQNFVYDAFGSLLSVTDSLFNALMSATYDYGVRPFQRTLTDTDLGSRSMTYNALGELVSWSDGKGQSASATYDTLSRPLTRTEADLSTTWTWGNTAAAHNIGRLASVSAGSYQEAYTYDSIGRPSSTSITIPSDATYTYDSVYNSTTGLLDTLTYPTSTSSYRLKLQYSYQNGILHQISDFNAPSTVFWTANATNARGQVTQETLGNGVVTNRAFDAVTGWLSSLQSGVGGGAALQNDSYAFDLAGNVTQRQNNNGGLTENFFYDNLYRLDHSTLGGTQNLALTYDGTGNITSRTDVASGATWTYGTSRKHAVTQAGAGGVSYTYDANGNVTTRNGSTISWTSFDHPSVINSGPESVQFSYNQDHLRWRAIYSGSAGLETIYFVGGLLEKVITAGSNDYRHFVFANGTQVAVYSRTSTGTNTLHYMREDHQGSVAAILNSDGTTYAKESFTAFGNRRSSCTWSGSPTNGNLTAINAVTRHGYTWHTALGAMGLNDMNGRIQDAVTGRFLSADPYVSSPGNTQAYNRYSYVMNNPLTYNDPSGYAASGAHGKTLPYNMTPTTSGSINSVFTSSFIVSVSFVSSPSSTNMTTIHTDPFPDSVWRQTTNGVSAWFSALRSTGPSKWDGGGGSGGGSGGADGSRKPPREQNKVDNEQQGQQQKRTQCPKKSSSGSYLSNVVRNVANTNAALPGLLAPTGTGLLTAGVTSEAWLGTRTATAGRWVFSGFSQIRAGAAVFTTAESGVLVGATAVMNFAMTGVSYEAGVAGGSLISAIPTGSGNTVRDSLANGLYDLFGPESEAPELACGW
jgi:RHS repeat-associated protein